MPVPDDVTSISIGLPVYNGGPHLLAAIESLLTQDLSDFELLISDNASSDETEEICRAFADRDPRVRYIRHGQNRGAAWNFNFVFRATSQPLFLWAAHDDIWHPSFLSRCALRLEDAPDAVACHTGWRAVDDRGHVVDHPCPVVEVGGSVLERWSRAQRDWTVHAAVYSLMRRRALEQTRLFRPMISADVVLITELLLAGPIVAVPDVLLDKRVPRDGRAYRSPGEMAAYIAGRRAGSGFLRLRVVGAELAALARRSAIPLRTRGQMAATAATAYITQGYWSIDLKELAHRMMRGRTG